MINWIKRLFHKKENESVKESINVVASIGKAKSLYKELIVKAHPDKHPNQLELATTLTELINKNRCDVTIFINSLHIISRVPCCNSIT